MDNIFKDAYFGKAYKTRDGRKAIYIYKSNIYPFRHILSLGGVENAKYKGNGLYDMKIEAENYHADIISEWDEPINEEKLTKLADESYPCWDCGSSKGVDCDICMNPGLIEAFKVGYRKAMEEKQ